jgi:alpha-L-fucosidase
MATGCTQQTNKETFDSSRESLEQYCCPDRFRDARSGIWTCWNPYTVPAQDDRYARNMYIEGSKHYNCHFEHYGHSSKAGYKDIIEMWKGGKFDPESMVALFRGAGAGYIAVIWKYTF